MTMAYTDDEIRRQLRLGGFDEQTVAGTGFSTLDRELWKPLLSAEGLRDPQLGLEKLGLLRTDGHSAVLATVAGILTCARQPREFVPGAEVTAVRYKGADRASGQVDAQDIAGPINEQITQALAFVVRNMRVGARKDPARVNLPEYSSRATVVVTVRSGGSPLAGADVLALFPNNTWKRNRTDTEGEARLDLHSVHLPMTVFVAREGCAAHVERGWLPMERALAVELAPKAGGGSVVFAESTGQLPGLAGRLNPILDTSHRTYLYASNIAINGGQQQPVSFVPGEEDLHLTDVDGKSLLVRVIAIAGQSSVLDYSPV